jgi:hypothetical protein
MLPSVRNVFSAGASPAAAEARDRRRAAHLSGAGYTDRLENLGLFQGTPPTMARIGFPSTTTGRQFFAKISYLFRF